MSNNYWQSPDNRQGQAGPGGPSPRKSGLLSNYGGQGKPASMPLPPGNNPALQGPASSSILPPPVPGQQGPSSLMPGQPMQQRTQWNGPGFMQRPAQVVQRVSATMAALRRPGPAVDPHPLVRYRGPEPPAGPEVRPAPKRAEPWRRSRTQRIAHLKRRRRERFMSGGPGRQRLRMIVLSSLAAVLLILLSSTLGYAYNFYEGEVPLLQGLANKQIPQTTRIYDRHGTLLYSLYDNTVWGLGGRSTPVSYYDLPKVLQDAQLAAEDSTFWTNNGVDPQGTLRAFTEYLSHGGQIAGGGSTITQQLIKNLSHNDDPSFQRKASEAALAIALTNEYGKKKILEMYFNDSPYGAQESGVEAAAEDYFGLKPQCNEKHQCVPAIQFLDRDLSNCKVTKPQIDETTCDVDPILALARAAMLAGIPQNPTSFDPSTSEVNRQNLLTNRLPYVLDQMRLDGMTIDLGLGDKNDMRQPITPEIEAQAEAKAATIKIVSFHQTMLAPHFVQWIIDTLAVDLGGGTSPDQYDTGLRILKSSGLNIYTTLDLNLEQFVEKDIAHNLHDRVYQEFLGTYGPLNTMYNVNDSAAVVMDAKTGEVLAMAGSANYSDTQKTDPTRYKQVAGQVNATRSPLQPGSTIKPIVYATAFQMGWYPGIRMIDNKTEFPKGNGSTYTPSDYLNSYHPNLWQDIRISLQNSYNVPAVKALMFAGLENVANTARRMGITAIDSDLATYFPGNTLEQAYFPSFALGTAGIPPIQMVDAYQTFADNGLHVPTHNILDIWDNYGNNLYHYDPSHPNASRVLSPQVSFLITNMLTDNYARRYEFTGIDTLTMQDWHNQMVAAKTGTTDGFKDNWTLGYTTSLVVGVWSGNADGMPMANNVIGVTGAGPIWHDIIEYASGRPMLGMHTDLNLPPGTFPTPAGVVQASVNTINGLQGTGTVDWMIDGEQPQQTGLPNCTTGDPGNGDGNGNNNNNGTGTGNGTDPLTCTPTNPGGNGDSTDNGNGNGDIIGDNPLDGSDPSASW